MSLEMIIAISAVAVVFIIVSIVMGKNKSKKADVRRGFLVRLRSSLTLHTRIDMIMSVFLSSIL
ncbi:MAG TPA: hypothetical protein VFG29_04435 [Syntrophales bacterium]|nr:hypothetical protein [Syntrophales bacterium]